MELQHQIKDENETLDHYSKPEDQPVIEETGPEVAETPEVPTEALDPSIEYTKPEAQPDNWYQNLMSEHLKPGINAKDAAVLGVIDFGVDAVNLIPGMGGVKRWWTDNSPRSDHPAHKIVRDASSIIIPTLAGGGAIVGKAQVATKSMSLPKYSRTIGKVSALLGVDTAVTAISSHSTRDHNIAGTLNNWLGWNIPWATRDSDSPDVFRKKNVYEAAGMSFASSLLELTYGLNKITRTLPKTDKAAKAVKPRNIKVEDNTTQAVELLESGRKEAKRQEILKRLAADPEGTKYDPFINKETIGPEATVTMGNNPDPTGAALDYVRIEQNMGTTNGRARPVVTDGTMNFISDADPTIRSQEIKKLFDEAAINETAAEVGSVIIPPDELAKSVNRLYDKVFDSEVPLKEIEDIVSGMKLNVFQQKKFLNEENFNVLSKVFRKSLLDIYDTDVMKGSAMIANQAAGEISDAAAAVSVLGETLNSGRQQQLIFQKLKTLTREIRTNQYISGKMLQYKKLAKTASASKNPSLLHGWLLDQNEEFTKGFTAIQRESGDILETLEEISQRNPEYLKPLILAFEQTNGKVDEIHKLHRWAENNIGLIKKGFIDMNPEIPSQIVRGLRALRYNNILFGRAPIRAAAGNMMLSVFKPLTQFAGAVASGEVGTIKRTLWTYGGVSHNLKRAYKHMGEEWKLAVSNPDIARNRGRVDLNKGATELETFETMDAMKEAWIVDGKKGKAAMWNLAQGLSAYNNNPIVRNGINALYAVDGFTNSLMASGSARAKAYDQLFSQTNGSINVENFNKLQDDLYNQAFDKTGLLTDTAAKHASSEIALNLDNETVNAIENLIKYVPAAESLFLFPRTGINALGVAWSYAPGSGLLPSMHKARRVFTAKTKSEIAEVLQEHGIGQFNMPDFLALKSEYYGRQLMGGAVVTAAGLWALEGNLIGNGPTNYGERKRMRNMGMKFNVIKNPITGEWHNYKGIEPFDTFLGLVADGVTNANRIDSAPTEQLFQKLIFSISMNVANKTFLSGFEPLVSMLSGDEGAWKRFMVNNVDMMTPGTGIRSALNATITPQLKDVDNDYKELMKNKWKFLYRGDDKLNDLKDIYTGESMGNADPITAATNAFLPFLQNKGGMEPWRQWMLGTGWDGLSQVEWNTVTNDKLDTEDRMFMNNWIAKNCHIKEQIIGLMNRDDKWMDKKLKEYKKARGLKTQQDYPIKELIVHKELTRIHKDAVYLASNALQKHRETYSTQGAYKKRIKASLNRGDIPESLKAHDKLQELKKLNEFPN